MFYSTTIRDVQAKLDTIADTQATAVSSLKNAVENVTHDKRAATQQLNANANALVIADDQTRYDALTRAAEGAGESYNFSAIVARWTREDEQNRAERAALGEKWGSRAEVQKTTSEFKSNVDLHDEALAKVSPEISQFDETTAAIRAHNEKYAKRPSAQITRENHDSFETLGGGSTSKIKNFFKATWRLMQAAVGFLGPFRAWRIMSKYNKQYGDFFEDAADIAALRENEKKLKADRAGLHAEYTKYAGIGSHMDSLDGSYKGSEGIANGIRQLVRGLLPKSDSFIEGVLREVPGEAAQAAALATVKLETFTTLESKAAQQLSNAESTLSQINDPLEYLQGHRVSPVKGKGVDFDASSVERNVRAATKTSKASAAALNAASDALEALSVPVGTSLASMNQKVKDVGSVSVDSNQLLLDFSGLKSNVSRIVKDYEDEQERIRQAEIRAAEQRRREQQAIQDAFNTATRINTRHSSPGISRPSGGGFSVGGGASGVSRSGGFKVGGGAGGIRR